MESNMDTRIRELFGVDGVPIVGDFIVVFAKSSMTGPTFAMAWNQGHNLGREVALSDVSAELLEELRLRARAASSLGL